MPNELVLINNTLNSSATDEALTAALGKILNDKKVTGSVGNTTPTSSSFVENEAVYFLYNSNNSNVLILLILNAVYPVGSYYWSSNSTNPGSLFGGTWTQVTDKFVLAAGSTYTAGDTGGEATHTLTLNEAPAHTHERGTMDITGMVRCYSEYNKGNTSFDTSGVSGAFYFRTGTDSEYGTSTNLASGSNDAVRNVLFQASKSWSGATDSKGGGIAHNNMPPYEVAYCWKRTA